MTVENWPGIKTYTVSGTGPYAINYEYTAQSIIVQVAVDGGLQGLEREDFSVTPEKGDSGNVTLSAQAAEDHAGRTLFIERDTIIQQAWTASGGGQSVGLSPQLDRLTMGLQELKYEMDRTVKFRDPHQRLLDMAQGQILQWDTGRKSLVPGPTADQVAGAQGFAQAAEAAAEDAEAARDAINARLFETRAEAEAANTGDAKYIYIGDLAYKQAPAVYVWSALKTGDDKFWVPAGDASIWHWPIVGDGVADDAPELTKAFNWMSSNQTTLRDHIGGTYRLGSRIEVISSSGATTVWCQFKGLTRGSTQNYTNFTVDGSENSDGGFLFQKNGPLLFVDFRGATFTAKSESGNCGLAIEVDAIQGGATKLTPVFVENVYGRTEDETVLRNTTTGENDVTNPGYFDYTLRLSRIGRPHVRYCSHIGPKQLSDLPAHETEANDAIRFADDSVDFLSECGFELIDCYGPLFEWVQSRQCVDGFRHIADQVSVEGGTFDDFVVVNAKRGFVRDRAAGSTSGLKEPGLLLKPIHINARDYCAWIDGVKLAEIRGGLYYMQNTQAGTHGIATPTTIYFARGEGHLVTGTVLAGSSPNARAVHHTGVHVPNGAVPFTAHGNILAGQFGTGFKCDVENADAWRPDCRGNTYTANTAAQISYDSQEQYEPFCETEHGGTYDPTVTAVANVDAATPTTFSYRRTGDWVEVFGEIAVDATSGGGTLTRFDIDPPVVGEGAGFLQLRRYASGNLVGGVGNPDVHGMVYASGGKLRVEYLSNATANRICTLKFWYRIV